MAGDYEQAMAYYSPGFRAVYSTADLQLRNAGVIGWDGATVDRVECSMKAEEARIVTSTPDSCVVVMTAKYSLGRDQLPMVRPRRENWRLVDGGWYFDNAP